MSEVARIGNVIFLRDAKAQKIAPPALQIERLTETCRWVVKEGAKCNHIIMDSLRCYRAPEFVVFAPGSNIARGGVCSHCLGDFCADVLERPKAEAEKIAATRLERLQRRQADKENREAHEAARLCTGWSKRAPFNRCQQQPKYVVGTQHRFCARHAVRARRWKWDLREITDRSQNKLGLGA